MCKENVLIYLIENDLGLIQLPSIIGIHTKAECKIYILLNYTFNEGHLDPLIM